MTGSEPTYEFADFRLNPRRRLLCRKSGEAVVLAGKSLDALIYLVEHAGTLVPRAELMKALWATTVVEDNSLTQTISALRRALGDEQGAQRLIATVSGRGYQFVGGVRVSSSGKPPEEPSEGPPTSFVPRTRVLSRQRFLALGAIAVVLLVAAAIAVTRYLVAERDGKGSSQSAVAVLPFRNLSPDPNDAYFAAGLHEEVLSQLAKVGGITVIGRTSVMGYADSTRPTAEIARELAVGAVLEGSASRAGDRVRVSVRLVGADTGGVLWSDVYDGDFADVFRIQADIATEIAQALGSRLSPADRSNVERRPTASLEAYALYLRAVASYRAAGGIGPTMPAGERAQMHALLDRAIALDSGFAAAYAWQAYAYVDSLFFDALPEGDWVRRSEQWIASAEQNAERALSLDAGSSVAHVARARLDMYRARFADSRATLELARSANPSDSQALQQIALLNSLLGDFPRAIAAARRALELDPKNPGSYAPIAAALQLSGQPAEAAATAGAMIDAAPGAPIAYVLLARAELARGDVGKALEAVSVAEQLGGASSPVPAIDLAVAYRRLGRAADAERLADIFAAGTQGLYVSPALRAAERLARGDDEGALREARAAFESRGLGASPLELAAFQWNVWSYPLLEEPAWRELRNAMAIHD